MRRKTLIVAALTAASVPMMAVPAFGQTLSECLSDPTLPGCSNLTLTSSSSIAAGFWIALGIAWLLIGLLTSETWHSRGGSRIFGLAAGLLFGPIGLLYAGLAKPGRGRCRECLNAVPDLASRCPTCGSTSWDKEED